MRGIGVEMLAKLFGATEFLVAYLDLGADVPESAGQLIMVGVAASRRRSFRPGPPHRGRSRHALASRSRQRADKRAAPTLALADFSVWLARCSNAVSPLLAPCSRSFNSAGALSRKSVITRFTISGRPSRCSCANAFSTPSSIGSISLASMAAAGGAAGGGAGGGDEATNVR